MLILMYYKLHFRIALCLVISLYLLIYASSLFLKGEGSSGWDSKQGKGAGAKLMQHCYNSVDIAARLCWCCFSFLCFLDSNYIHRFWVYSCIYHFSRFRLVEFNFICDACGVTALFPCHFLFFTDLVDFCLNY